MLERGEDVFPPLPSEFQWNFKISAFHDEEKNIKIILYYNKREGTKLRLNETIMSDVYKQQVSYKEINNLDDLSGELFPRSFLTFKLSQASPRQTSLVGCDRALV